MSDRSYAEFQGCVGTTMAKHNVHFRFIGGSYSKARHVKARTEWLTIGQGAKEYKRMYTAATQLQPWMGWAGSNEEVESATEADDEALSMSCL